MGRGLTDIQDHSAQGRADCLSCSVADGIFNLALHVVRYGVRLLWRAEGFAGIKLSRRWADFQASRAGDAFPLRLRGASPFAARKCRAAGGAAFLPRLYDADDSRRA